MVFDDKSYIAGKIKLARKSAKLTQEELADRIGITSKQLSRIENATYIPSVPTFLKIIKVLQIDLCEFGLENYSHENKDRENFIKLILSLPSDQLSFCFNIVKTITDNFEVLNKK